MCWIGKKTGGKRFYGNWESIALEVDLLLLRFPPITQAHSLLHPHAHTNMCTPMSEQVTEVLITVMARWKRGQKDEGGVRTGEKWRCRERRTVGRRQAHILASDCQLWQQTERKIIVSSRVWLPSLPLFSTNKAPFNICISFNFMVRQANTSKALYQYTRLASDKHTTCYMDPVYQTLSRCYTEQECSKYLTLRRSCN